MKEAHRRKKNSGRSLFLRTVATIYQFGQWINSLLCTSARPTCALARSSSVAAADWPVANGLATSFCHCLDVPNRPGLVQSRMVHISWYEFWIVVPVNPNRRTHANWCSAIVSFEDTFFTRCTSSTNTQLQAKSSRRSMSFLAMSKLVTTKVSLGDRLLGSYSPKMRIVPTDI